MTRRCAASCSKAATRKTVLSPAAMRRVGKSQSSSIMTIGTRRVRRPSRACGRPGSGSVLTHWLGGRFMAAHSRFSAHGAGAGAGGVEGRADGREDAGAGLVQGCPDEGAGGLDVAAAAECASDRVHVHLAGGTEGDLGGAIGGFAE